MHALHERYGPVVRVGPNHLSYTDVRAWRDVQGHRAGDHLSLDENPKSSLFYREAIIDRPGNPRSILDADREEHGRLRRAVAAGFSERAMRAQEPLIAGYVDALIRGLRKRAEAGEVVDVLTWYNWTTFDVVGDLVFAESFGCLEGERGHPFPDAVTGSVTELALLMALKYSGLGRLRVVKWLFNVLLKYVMSLESLKEMNRIMEEKLQRRLDYKEERTDLFEGLMSKREEWVSAFLCPITCI